MMLLKICAGVLHGYAILIAHLCYGVMRSAASIRMEPDAYTARSDRPPSKIAVVYTEAPTASYWKALALAKQDLERRS
jgi:hypothetical protein